MKAGQVLGAVQAIYDCLAEGGDERHLLDALRTSVGAEHVVMRCFANGDVARTSTCGRLAGIDLGIFDQIAESDDFDAVMRRIRPGPAIRMSSLVPPKEFERNPIYQEIIRPLNGGLASIALHQDEMETVSVVACRSAVTDPDFSDGDLSVIDILVPHLITASRIARRIADLEHAASGAYRLLDALSEAVIVLDRAFRPIYLNRGAEMIARQENGLRISRDGVRATEEAEDARLQAAVRLAATLDEHGSEDEAEGPALAQMRLAISNAPARPPLIVSLVPAGAVPGAPRDGRASVILLIAGAEKTCDLSLIAMRTQYRLTQREAELTARLCRGNRLAEAASHLGISVGTARQYLKAIFEKTGVNRQIDLVRLVGPA